MIGQKTNKSGADHLGPMEIMNKIDKAEAGSNVVLSQLELAKLGGGHLAYIKKVSPDDVGRMFPNIEGLPKGIALFALHAADGTPLALTDSLHAALSQAMDEELQVARLN